MTIRTRSAELRARNRTVYFWSFTVAALAYVVVLFVWAPTFEIESLDGTPIQQRSTVQFAESPTFVEVLFGPPEISGADGTVWQEPGERVLEIGRLLELPPECSASLASGQVREPAFGFVRLRVLVDGHVDVDSVELTQSTGDACGDRVIAAVADALWYHWLPNERFPAPVDLIQPIMLERSTEFVLPTRSIQ